MVLLGQIGRKTVVSEPIRWTFVYHVKFSARPVRLSWFHGYRISTQAEKPSWRGKLGSLASVFGSHPLCRVFRFYWFSRRCVSEKA